MTPVAALCLVSGRVWSTGLAATTVIGHGSTTGRSASPSADLPDGFGVAVVREDGKWHCSAMAPNSLTSLSTAETELRELRSAGAVFGLIDVDDEFFVIVRPAPSGTRLLLSDATAALDYDIAAEVLDKLDADIDPEDLEDAEPFEEGDLGLLSDVGLPEAVLGVILDENRPLRRRAAGPYCPGDGLRRRAVGGDRPLRSVIASAAVDRKRGQPAHGCHARPGEAGRRRQTVGDRRRSDPRRAGGCRDGGSS